MTRSVRSLSTAPSASTYSLRVVYAARVIVQRRIEEKLVLALAPLHLTVENESRMHSVPAGSETHFKVLVVSAAFEGVSRVDRQRRVNEALKDELATGVHALTMRTLTPGEWEKDGGALAASFESPRCLGGSKTGAG